MCGQLLVTLVLRVDGQEKRVGVRYVKHDRNVEFCRFVEQRSEPFIIDLEKLAPRIDEAGSKILP
jgi:hypothetical protein